MHPRQADKERRQEDRLWPNKCKWLIRRKLYCDDCIDFDRETVWRISPGQCDNYDEARPRPQLFLQGLRGGVQGGCQSVLRCRRQGRRPQRSFHVFSHFLEMRNFTTYLCAKIYYLASKNGKCHTCGHGVVCVYVPFMWLCKLHIYRRPWTMYY